VATDLAFLMMQREAMTSLGHEYQPVKNAEQNITNGLEVVFPLRILFVAMRDQRFIMNIKVACLGKTGSYCMFLWQSQYSSTF
jgi:hypothetical protein